MTPEELVALLTPREGEFMFTAPDAMRLAEATAPLTEAERKKLAKVARDFWKDARQTFKHNDYEFAYLAALAVGSAGDAKKVQSSYFDRFEDTALKILVDRRPEWADAWLEEKLDEEWPRISWKLVRGLVSAGACKKPDSRGYATVMSRDVIHGRGAEADGKAAIRLVRQLTKEPDLIEDVWRFFKQDVAPFYDGWPWAGAIRDLSRQGLLDRQRLLDEALRALFHDVKDDVRSRFAYFYRKMEPTAEERAARQAVMRELLSHRSSPMVKFALEELAELGKDGALDERAFLGAGSSVFALKQKGQPMAALKLTAGMAKKRAELVPAAIGFVLGGLGHDSADVQKKALEMLTAWRERLHRDHLVEIRERLEGLAATNRAAAEELVAGLSGAGQRSGAHGASATAKAETNEATEGRSEILARLEGLDPKWRALAGVDEALAAAREMRLPRAVAFRVLDVPVLTGVERVEPIQMVDELLDATAHAIEVIDSGDELERILDGISRLGSERPKDFELRAEPLAARLLSDPKDAIHGLRNRYTVTCGVRDLIRSWLAGPKHEIAEESWYHESYHHQKIVDEMVSSRAAEILRRVLLGQSRPTLAAPTHAGGWVEPATFVQRIGRFPAGETLPRADLILALLRLAPDGRAAALEAARSLDGNEGRAVRWALGGDEGPVEADKEQFALWLAAGRARNPHGELTELVGLVSGDEAAALALHPPTFRWKPFERKREGLYWRPSGAVGLDLQSTLAEICSPAAPTLPTFAFSQLAHDNTFGLMSLFSSGWKTLWTQSFWPLNCETHWAAGATALAQRVNAPASSLEPNFVFLLSLLEPDRPWTELAYLDCWMALVSKDASSLGMGVDCLIRAIEDGRACVEQSAEVVGRMMEGGWVKLNRVAASLAEVGRVSPLHTWWTAEFLQALVVRMKMGEKDLHQLLALLQEQLAELGLALGTRAKEHLDASASTLQGKAGTLAKQLGKLTGGGGAKAREALERALEGRVARARRWAG